MAEDLDDFLGDVPGEAPPAAPPPVPVPDPAAPAEPEAAADDSAAPADPAESAAVEPEDVTGLKSALQATRRERADHKGRADRLDGEAAALRAEIEALRRSAPAPAPPPPAAPREPVAIPSPLEDPQGYHEYMQRTLFNERLNMSEAMLRQSVDSADVDAKLAVFKKAADTNPSLRAELTRQVHPYRWAYDQAQRFMAMDEIGTDPAAFRAKIEAEIRAQIEAEMAGPASAAPAAERPVLPRSLGTARSSGSRSAPVLNIPESFDDILASPRR